MISGLSPKDFCSIFSETCCCVEQRGTAEEGWQRGDVPLSPPSDIFSTFSSFIKVFSAMKHRDLQEWKLFEGGEEADRPPTREEMSSDMAGERMEDGQAYFTPVCSDHFVLIVHLCSRIVPALITQEPSTLLQPNAPRGGNLICGTLGVLWRRPTRTCIFL